MLRPAAVPADRTLAGTGTATMVRPVRARACCQPAVTGWRGPLR